MLADPIIVRLPELQIRQHGLCYCLCSAIVLSTDACTKGFQLAGYVVIQIEIQLNPCLLQLDSILQALLQMFAALIVIQTETQLFCESCKNSALPIAAIG